MNPFDRWQWQWKSRIRLGTIGAFILALGLLFIGLAVLDVKSGRQFGRLIASGVIVSGIGGYKILQSLFSDEGAFGDHQ